MNSALSGHAGVAPAVLVFGGMGEERFVSVASAINLSRRYEFSDALFIDDKGLCHRVQCKDLATATASYTNYPEFSRQYLCSGVDLLTPDYFGLEAIFFLALHGTYGEDGQIQKILDSKGIAYTGSGYEASCLAFEKTETKKIAIKNGVRIANSVSFADVGNYLGTSKALILKHKANGSSNGVEKFRNAETLQEHLKNIADKENYFIEEIVLGREFSCGVFETAEGSIRALEPIEIVHNSFFFDYQTKYTDKSVREICPCDLPQEDKERIKELALKMHLAVGCKGYSRSDFILDGDPCFLEINTLPGLSENSLYPRELRAEGIDFAEFVSEQLQLALLKKGTPFMKQNTVSLPQTA